MLRKDGGINRSYRHGGYVGGKEIPEHYVWRTMLVRAGKERHYEHVKVCKRWKKYENFLADMGVRPTPAHSLDRYPNPFGHYCATNCRWATQAQQGANKRNTRLYTDGEFVGTTPQWAARIGISRELAWYRLRYWGTFKRGLVLKTKMLHERRWKGMSDA